MCQDACIELLNECDIACPETVWAVLERHLDLVRAWNDVASLVSQRDLDRLMVAHVVDSLSLAGPVVRACGGEGRLLDVGSGAGFPAIPLKVLLPGLDVTLVERSTRKVGFLRKAVATLGLPGVTVVAGEFPSCVRCGDSDVVTARAVERPGKILRAVAPFVDAGAVFLCQSRDPGAVLAPEFHVEHVRDAWTAKGLRRGELFIVRRVLE